MSEMGGTDWAAMALGAAPAVKVVLALLMIMSVVGWALILAGTVRQIAARGRLGRLLARLEGPVTERAAARPANRHDRSALTEAVDRALSGPIGPDSGHERGARAERLVLTAAGRELSALGAGLPLLGTIAATAPFIGLFGTVIGVMRAFEAVGRVQSATLATVAPGVAEALAATAVGLFTAIPAAAAFNFLSGGREALGEDLEIAAALLRQRIEDGPAAPAGQEGAGGAAEPVGTVGTIGPVGAVGVAAPAGTSGSVESAGTAEAGEVTGPGGGAGPGGTTGPRGPDGVVAGGGRGPGGGA